MASHSQLSVTENYTSLLETRIEGRMQDQARMFDPATSSPTNLINNAIRWSSASNKWQIWNGTTWLDLTSTFAISISGNSATATKLATARNIGGVSFDGTANINLPGVNTTGNQNTTGNAATVTNGVYTIGNQSISGVKTFNDNVGIGGSPNSWGALYKVLQVFGSSLSRNDSVGAMLNLSNNVYFDSSNQPRYILSAGATYYRQGFTVSDHAWFTAPAGTAGNAISFTQAMTLDANGNLGVGTSSPVARLHVENGSVITRSSDLTTSFTATSNQNTGYTTSFATNWDENILLISAAGKKVLEVGGFTAANSLRLFTGNTERMRLDANGKLILSASNQGIQFADGTTQTTAATAPSTSSVLAATAGAAVGAVGTYAMLISNHTQDFGPGDTATGFLSYSAAGAWGDGTLVQGTWRCCGYSRSFATRTSQDQGVTLWLRIS